MNWIFGIIALCAVGGVVLAIIEKRRGAHFLKHDFNQDAPQTEADRENIRIVDQTIQRIQMPPH